MPLLVLAAFLSMALHVEPILVQVLLALSLIGAFLPSTALTVVATMAVISVTDSALLPVAAAALTLGVLWRVTTLVDRLFGVAFAVALVAFRGEVMIPFWLWFLLIFPALIVIINRKVLTDAVASARSQGPVDRNPSRNLNPVTSVALERAGWPLVAEIDGRYLHSSPLPGTYALCTETFVFLVTRFGSCLLTTTNGAAGPELSYELVQRITSRRPGIDALVSRHQEAVELVVPDAGPPTPLEDVVSAHQEDQSREVAVIEAEGWKLAAGMAWSLFSCPERALDGEPRSRRRIERWLEHMPAQP